MEELVYLEARLTSVRTSLGNARKLVTDLTSEERELEQRYATAELNSAATEGLDKALALYDLRSLRSGGVHYQRAMNRFVQVINARLSWPDQRLNRGGSWTLRARLNPTDRPEDMELLAQTLSEFVAAVELRQSQGCYLGLALEVMPTRQPNNRRCPHCEEPFLRLAWEEGHWAMRGVGVLGGRWGREAEEYTDATPLLVKALEYTRHDH